jgi:hypothetical protein
LLAHFFLKHTGPMKKNVLFVLLCCALLTSEKFISQSWTWDQYANLNDSKKKICTDAANNLYLYARYDYLVYPYSDTVKKITPSGQLLWQLILPPNMQLNSLVTAPDLSVFMSGAFSGTLSFGGNTHTCSGPMDIWIAKYNSSGTLLWFKTVVSSGNDYPWGMCMNGTGVVLTGKISNTVNFLGQTISKQLSEDLFVATITGGGSLQAVKFSVGTTSVGNTYSNSTSIGMECGRDAAGNIYVMAFSYGENKIDTFRIGHWGPHTNMQPRCYTIIKFNQSLQPLNVYMIEDCPYGIYCGVFYDLNVNAAGESYFIERFSYHQSGNDDLWCIIHKVSTTGSLTATYRHRQDRNSEIFDIVSDACGNIYFTGYWRTVNYSQPAYYSMVTGRLTPSLTLAWLWQDSTASSWVQGNSIGVLGMNDLFISGAFRDTITLASTLISPTLTTGFFGRLSAPGAVPCTPVTELFGENLKELPVYPNPTSGKIFVDCSNQDCEFSIYSIEGSLISSGITKGTIDLRDQPAGIYFISLFHPDGINKRAKIIIEK